MSNKMKISSSIRVWAIVYQEVPIMSMHKLDQEVPIVGWISWILTSMCSSKNSWTTSWTTPNCKTFTGKEWMLTMAKSSCKGWGWRTTAHAITSLFWTSNPFDAKRLGIHSAQREGQLSGMPLQWRWATRWGRLWRTWRRALLWCCKVKLCNCANGGMDNGRLWGCAGVCVVESMLTSPTVSRKIVPQNIFLGGLKKLLGVLFDSSNSSTNFGSKTDLKWVRSAWAKKMLSTAGQKLIETTYFLVVTPVLWIGYL
jgi:hypothetical protein